MKTPEIFTGPLHDEMVTIAESTGVGVPTVEATALTLLSGLIGQTVLLPGSCGATPLSLLTVAILPPIKESQILIGAMVGTIDDACRDAQTAFGDSDSKVAQHFLDSYSKQVAGMEKLGYAPGIEDLKNKYEQARLAVCNKLVMGPNDKLSEQVLANAHDGTLTWAVTGDDLLKLEGKPREAFIELTGLGFTNTHGKDRAKGQGHALAAVIGIARPSLRYVAAFKDEGEPVPFLVIESPTESGLAKLGRFRSIPVWKKVISAFLHERMFSPIRVLASPANLGPETGRFLKQGINALTDRNPALMPFLSPGLTVMLRVAALLTLVDDPKATAVAPAALTKAADFCTYWMKSHAKAIGRVLPRPAMPRRPMQKEFNVPLDRGRLLVSISKRGTVSRKQIRENMARARPRGYWDARLMELEERGCVAYQAKMSVSILPMPLERLAVLEGDGFLIHPKPVAKMKRPISPSSPSKHPNAEKVEVAN